MTIIWKSFPPERPEGTSNFGGCGGFFDRGMRWKDYLDRAFYAEDHARMEELRAAIVGRPVWRDGSWHQDQADAGMPVWDDGAVFWASQRAWGDLLAAVWSTVLDQDFWYGDFAWDVPDVPKRPGPSADLPSVGSFHA